MSTLRNAYLRVTNYNCWWRARTPTIMMPSSTQLMLISFLFSTIEAVDEQKSFISLRDEEFVGPDKRLEEELAQRRAGSLAIQREITALERGPPPPRSLGADLGEPRPDTRRTSNRASLERDSKWVFSDIRYEPEFEKIRILQFQRFLLELAQERISDLKTIVREYESDERFRIAFIFSKLRRWLNEMRQYFYSSQLHNVHRPVRKHLLYYEVLVRKNIDITYTVEFFLHIHVNYFEQLLKSFHLTPAAMEQIKKIQQH